MKITDVRIRRLYGTMNTEGPFWEERLLRPIDVYPDYRVRDIAEAHGGQQVDSNTLKIKGDYLEIHTDEGVTGIAGPVWEVCSHMIMTSLKPIIMGKDPLAIELLWDQMHRLQVHGRQGHMMVAISAIDCALWDLKGRYFKQPIWRILGGPTQASLPAYASMLGYVVEDLGLVKDRALAAKAKGYTAQKWFIRHGPMSGHEGMKKNVALVRTLRETLGDDYDIMIDAWQSLNLDYATDFCHRIEEFRPRWIEECFMPDRIESYAELRRRTRIPLSGAEHEYTRWGFQRFFEKKALDIIQPDIYWCGGLSETLKIAAVATTLDLITIPHGHSTPIGIHFSVTQSPIHTPYQEYLVKWNDIHMHFLKNPLWPVNGSIPLPEAPGANMDLDPAKIDREEMING